MGTHPRTQREVIIVRVLPLHGVIQVRLDPFDAGLVVIDAASLRVFGGIEVLNEEPRHVGEEEDGHFFDFVFFSPLLCCFWLGRNEEWVG